jgi:hypothetical protein
MYNFCLKIDTDDVLFWYYQKMVLIDCTDEKIGLLLEFEVKPFFS